jgi:hypothetical protein
MGNVLRDVVESVKGLNLPGEVTIQQDERFTLTDVRLLYDVEFDDNLELPLSELGILNGSKLTITNDNDEDESKNVCVILFIVNRLSTLT